MAIGRRRGPGWTPGKLWAVRATVLLALGLTLWWFGPRAAAVAAARLDAGRRDSPLVELDRVGFVTAPDWLRGPVLLAVARDLEPVLRGRQPILDEAAGLALRQRLLALSWVAGAELERVFPDRFRLRLRIRRPELEVRDASGTPRCCVDRDAVVLPVVEDPDLPFLTLRDDERPESWPAPGQRFAREVVAAAVAVVREWRLELAPKVPGAPRLVEVDTNNLDQRWLWGPHHPEVRIGLATAGGEPASFAYGRPPGSSRSRVPVGIKAHVLRSVLAEHPGLQGITGGDLRFGNRWRDWLLPRPGPDPAGPWK